MIIGFALSDTNNKRLFDYADIKGEAHEIKANNINPYLVDAISVFLEKNRITLQNNSPLMAKGSIPYDGGFLLFNEDEKNEFLSKEPQAQKFIRPFLGGEEFINNIKRYCLWLVDATPAELKSMPLVMARLEEIKKSRSASTRKITNELAATPMLFGEIRQPKTNYLAIPEVSSERRHFIPIGFLTPDIIASNKLYTVSDATIYHFGILTSTMHMAWTRTVCGRLKSDYQYSAGIVYNNFPWPMDVTDKQKKAIEDAAQAVLNARAAHVGASLADLYDPLTMPPDLVKAHRALDSAVDTAYSKRKFTGDSDRVAFLFDLYQTLSAPLDIKKPKGKKKKP